MSDFSLNSITSAASSAIGSVTSAASSALHGVEDLGSSALSHAKDLGRQGADLGRQALTAASHIDVQKLSDAAIKSVGKLETAADNGITKGVMTAGAKVHQAADAVRSHLQGGGVLGSAARGAVNFAENTTRFDIGVVGGVAKGATGLLGSAAQLGTLATEYQLSPSAHAAINAKVSGAVANGARSLVGYGESVAADPSRVIGDVSGAAHSAVGWAKGEVASGKTAIAEGHGPESAGMIGGNLATYLIPVGGEARAAVGVTEVATEGLARDVVEEGGRGTLAVGSDALTAGSKTVGRDLVQGSAAVAPTAGAATVASTEASAAAPHGVYFFDSAVLKFIDQPGATLGRAGEAHFFMPAEDSKLVTDAATAYRYTGGAPSLERAYTSNGKVFGVEFSTEGMTPRLPTAADTNLEHFLEGGHTALKLPDGAGYLVNPTHELVVPGGQAMPTGSTLFELGDGGARTPLRTW